MVAMAEETQQEAQQGIFGKLISILFLLSSIKKLGGVIIHVEH